MFNLYYYHVGNTLDLFLAVITSIIQIPQIKAWSGYQSFTIFQLMRFYRVLFAFPFLRDLVVRNKSLRKDV